MNFHRALSEHEAIIDGKRVDHHRYVAEMIYNRRKARFGASAYAMPATLAARQASPQIGAAGTPQPQTTPQQPGSGPFLRYARAASRPGYNRSGDNFGAQITNPLAAAPGYLRYLDFQLSAVAGAGATAPVAAADAPYNAVQLVQFKDPWGTPLITGGGYELLYILNKYAGQGLSPLYPGNTVSQAPSFAAIQTSSGAGAGNFTIHSLIPVEGTKGYGVVSIGNSSVLPSLLMAYAASGTVYTTPPATLPTLTTTLDEFYYDIDPTNPVEPPGNGSTFQTAVVQGNQTIGSAASTRVQLPRTGGYLTSLILVLRDVNSARVADTPGSGIGFASATGRIRVYIDGVPRFDETYVQLIDRMFGMTDGTPRDNGIAAYSFKLSLSQLNLGYLDSLEQALQTNPGTLIEVEMTPWGTIGAPPATLNAIVTQLVPSGPIAQGLPEV